MMDRPYRIHLSSLALNKTADGLIDPKLVLAWLLTAIGASGVLIGLLVPVREAGALLPQLLLARRIQRAQVRKYFWAVGAAVQGLAALGMAAAAVLLPGKTAGWVIIVLLAVLAMARSACSASYKDVLARTVEKGTRGKVSGSAATLGSIVVFAFAILLSIGWLPREPMIISGAIALAGCLWLAAAATFSTLKEERDTSAPFLVMLGSGNSDTEFGNLGLLVLASSIASIASSYLWGALSDRSSRQTLMLAGGLSGATLATAAITGFLGLDRYGQRRSQIALHSAIQHVDRCTFVIGRYIGRDCRCGRGRNCFIDLGGPQLFCDPVGLSTI